MAQWKGKGDGEVQEEEGKSKGKVLENEEKGGGGMLRLFFLDFFLDFI